MKKALTLLLLAALTCAGIYFLAPGYVRDITGEALFGSCAPFGSKGSVSQVSRLVYDGGSAPAASDGRPAD